MCVGGLGGNGQCSYMKSVIRAVAAKGFKIAFVLYRGTGGVPITTSKLYSIKEWRDIKEPADYLYKKHCENQKSRMYIYGCSLGGTVISHLLIKDKDHKFSGAVAYGNPFNMAEYI